MVAAIAKTANSVAGDEGAWTAEDFAGEMSGLADDLVNEDAYRSAAQLGRDAAPGADDASVDETVAVWIGRTRKYADAVPDRLAGELADAANKEEAKAESTVADVLARIDQKLEDLRSSVTRYAEPTWGTGWNGYGDALRGQNILMAWVLDSADPCADCVAIAAGSPYEELPTWPGAGETQCLDRCKCTIQADRDSWDAALGEAA